MEKQIAISINHVEKTYRIFDRPQDRLKQAVIGRDAKFYREFQALKDISFNVYKGETVGIIGQNGSGKSTLLQIIAGTLEPSNGEIQVNGKVAALLELGSGFNPEFTGKENIYMNGAILGLTVKDIDNLYDEIVDFANIGNFVDQPVKTYSSGMAVRLAFAVQAVVPKDILIVDEALAVGDELFQRKCFSKIESFKQTGGTILFVSHSGSSIVELCDRAILLDQGELLISGSSKNIVNLYQKLIYASPDKKESIRANLKDRMNQSDELVTEEQGNKEIPPAKYANDSNILTAQYDPNLVPQNSIEYVSQGAQLSNPKITTPEGKQVNLLLPNQRYIWTYTVTFDMDCYDVRFAMLIKTSTGFELGGAVSSKMGEGISEVKAGETIQVEFTFSTNLNTGTYFLNAGVHGIVNGEEVYLDRKIDFAVFKVLYEEISLRTAIIDFQVTPKVSKTKAS